MDESDETAAGHTSVSRPVSLERPIPRNLAHLITNEVRLLDEGDVDDALL